MISTNTDKFMETNAFLDQYTSENEISKYVRATAGSGINYLLDHDYKAVYLEALNLLPQQTRQGGIRILEFGCGGGMNLLRLISMLSSKGLHCQALALTFPRRWLKRPGARPRITFGGRIFTAFEFYVARNESLISDLSASAGIDEVKSPEFISLYSWGKHNSILPRREEGAGLR